MIELENLTKRYGSLTAVDHLTCTIEPGKLYGFLGVNGAGKTTTMNMITGCLAPTEGKVTICGEDLFTDPVAAKRHIGYLPERPPLYPDLTVREYLSFVADAKNIPAIRKRREVNRVMEQVSVLPVADKLIRNLSKGYWQRVGIAQAILGDPEIIILDEPTASLDPRQIVEIRRLIRSLKGKHTILLSSHILSEVAELCDVILILSGGKLVAMDTLQNLQAEFLHTDTLHLTVRCNPSRAEAAVKKIAGIQKITSTAQDSLTELAIECPKGVDIREQVFFAFSELRCPIVSMTLHEASLEEVFLTATLPEDTAPSALRKAPVGRGRPTSVAPPALPKKTTTKKPASPTKSEPEEDDDDYKPLFGRKEKDQQ
ncbi:MAG: ABC transporter ATP-binding protein [Clostridia bacterium]|nr:ABC transporter ATP-binding protein [Clostridia bacterium]